MQRALLTAGLVAGLMLVGATQSSAQTLAALKKAPCYMIDCPNAFITPLGKIPLTDPKPIYVKITVVQEALSPPPNPGAPWILSTTYGFAIPQVEYVMPMKGATTYTIHGLLPFDERGTNVSAPANALGIQILSLPKGLIPANPAATDPQLITEPAQDPQGQGQVTSWYMLNVIVTSLEIVPLPGQAKHHHHHAHHPAGGGMAGGTGTNGVGGEFSPAYRALMGTYGGSWGWNNGIVRRR
jgi:hypothetical protein